MVTTVELILVGVAVLLLLSVLVSKISDRFGIPTLLLFLVLGMLTGSDGPGGIYFDNPAIAQFVGIVALVFILFSGGLSTNWRHIAPVLKHGLVLSTAGVALTTLMMTVFAHGVLGFSVVNGLLLGAIVSSTDAAAVFAILRAQGLHLKSQLRSLLELESGSNDPMAVFLTIGVVQLLTLPTTQVTDLLLLFVLQMSIGALVGYAVGKAAPWLINQLRLGHEGLYPVLTLALAILTYGLTSMVYGNGFLAVYIAGLVLGNHDFIHKRSLLRFHDGVAWIMQIVMFLTLGLLVFPSRLPAVFGIGLLSAIWLMLVARPVSVFASLTLSRFDWRDKTFLSWAGLRGAVPIVLATYPLIAGIPQAELFFDIVFFVVLTSVLLQGTSLPFVARWLRVDTPPLPRRVYPLEYSPVGGLKSELRDLLIPPESDFVGQAIVELGLPAAFLIVLVAREGEFIVPTGALELHAGDTLLVLSEEQEYDEVRTRVCKTVESGSCPPSSI